MLRVALAELGFRVAEEIEMWEQFHFTSLDEVERWQRSTGVRRVLESLDDQRLSAYRAGLAARLEPLRTEDGGFRLDHARSLSSPMRRPDPRTGAPLVFERARPGGVRGCRARVAA